MCHAFPFLLPSCHLIIFLYGFLLLSAFIILGFPILLEQLILDHLLSTIPTVVNILTFQSQPFNILAFMILGDRIVIFTGFII